ncbi:nuclear factor erythroid 2-related factor 3-like [Dysidea avara]|uniref:nuclear factor erythroid 2-related factor 3-like n=1 Tax=Dysidea avara TaxID=196820 RepID=UPI003331BD2F
MEGDISEGFFCSLVDPDKEFELDLQQALLGEYNSPGDFPLSSDDELHLKSAVLHFDEDEGFNEDFNDETDLYNLLVPVDNNMNSRDDPGMVLFDQLNTNNWAASCDQWNSQLGSSCDSYYDSTYLDNSYCDNSVWLDNAVPMKLISSRDHVISPDTTIDTHCSPQSSPMPAQPGYYSAEQVEIHDDDDDVPSSSQNTNLPSSDELVTMPFYKFKRLLDDPSLTAKEKAEAKAIRKKGKNKHAAKHCRQRKMAKLDGLEHEVASLQDQLALLASQKAQLMAETRFWEGKCASLQSGL